jgi:hypothetical protein
MPMQPRPSAETSNPLRPGKRFFKSDLHPLTSTVHTGPQVCRITLADDLGAGEQLRDGFQVFRRQSNITMPPAATRIA